MTRSLAEEAADPKTTPQRMRELIQTDRSLYAAVACNPNVDEPLRQWLWVNGGRDVQEAMVRQYEEAVRAQQEAQAAKEKSEKSETPTGDEAAEEKATADGKASVDDSGNDKGGEPEVQKRRFSGKHSEKHVEEESPTYKPSVPVSIASERLAAERAEVERMIVENEKAERQKEVERVQAENQAELERLQAGRKETERLAAERAEAERLAHEEAARLEVARAEAERLEAERKALQARLDAEKAESERLNAEAAVRADEQRRLAEQHKAAAELASIQAEAQAFAAQTSAADHFPAPTDASDNDDAESTVVVNRSSRPKTRLVTAGGQSFELTNDVVILGRKPRGFLAGSVQLLNIKDTERTISKTHARLSWHDDAWYISDLGSTNGVSVGLGNSLIELSGSEEVQVNGPFALGLHDMNLEIAQ